MKSNPFNKKKTDFSSAKFRRVEQSMNKNLVTDSSGKYNGKRSKRIVDESLCLP